MNRQGGKTRTTGIIGRFFQAALQSEEVSEPA